MCSSQDKRKPTNRKKKFYYNSYNKLNYTYYKKMLWIITFNTFAIKFFFKNEISDIIKKKNKIQLTIIYKKN